MEESEDTCIPSYVITPPTPYKRRQSGPAVLHNSWAPAPFDGGLGYSQPPHMISDSQHDFSSLRPPVEPGSAWAIDPTSVQFWRTQNAPDLNTSLWKHLTSTSQIEPTNCFPATHITNVPTVALTSCVDAHFSGGMQSNTAQEAHINGSTPSTHIRPPFRPSPRPLTDRPNRKRPVPHDPQALYESTQSLQPPPKVARVEARPAPLPRDLHTGFIPSGDLDLGYDIAHRQSFPPKQADLTRTQKSFIKKWHKGIAKGQSIGFSLDDDIAALASLARAQKADVARYINKLATAPLRSSRTPPAREYRSNTQASNVSRTFGYSLSQANSHLPEDTLRLVDNYVRACHRNRARSDGRRRVNDGPYKCTFRCGYRTKRPYDWRRHEETHEPQELWLCQLCPRSLDQNHFLVNRKDKYLKHVQVVHPDMENEIEFLQESSKLRFKPNFDPDCPFCDETSSSWDGRCKHILQHFDDEHASETLGSSTRSGPISDENAFDADSSAESNEASDGDHEQNNSLHDPNRRDRTGGSGGGSGAMGGGFLPYQGDASEGNGSAAGLGNGFAMYSNMGSNSTFADGMITSSINILSSMRWYNMPIPMNAVGRCTARSRICRGDEEGLPSSRKLTGTRRRSNARHITFGLLPGASSRRTPAFAIFQLRRLASYNSSCWTLLRQIPVLPIMDLRASLSGYRSFRRVNPLDTRLRLRPSISGFSQPTPKQPPQPLVGDRAINVPQKKLTVTDQTDPRVSSRVTELGDDEMDAMSPNTCLVSTSPVASAYACACPSRKQHAPSLMYGLLDILRECEKAPYGSINLSFPGPIACNMSLQSPPAYDELHTQSVSISVFDMDPHQQSRFGNVEPLAQAKARGGKDGIRLRHEVANTTFKTAVHSRQARLCHHCLQRFSAPRLEVCRKCSHKRCEKCLFVESVRRPSRANREPREADDDLAVSGSQLLPPAYSLHDSGSCGWWIPTLGSTSDQVLDVSPEKTVANVKVVEERNPPRTVAEKHIKYCASRTHQPHRSLKSDDLQSIPTSGILPQYQSEADNESSSDASTTSTTPPPASAEANSVVELQTTTKEQRHHFNRRKHRRPILARSKHFNSSIPVQAMTDHHIADVELQQLHSRVNRFERPQSASGNGDTNRATTTMSGRTTSSFTGADTTLAQLPTFRKTETTSTTSTTSTNSTAVSNQVSRLHVMRTIPSPHLARDSASIEPGDFSKPPIRQRKRRTSNGSTDSHKEFQYYGRHANSWLFNDFSVTDSVKKGWGKVFSKSGSEGDGSA